MGLRSESRTNSHFGTNDMKRDWYVVRVILEEVEAGTLQTFIRSKEYEKDAATADPSVILGHIEILIDAGILKNCHVNRGSNGEFESWDLRAPFISMAGHDLLDALRDDTVWRRIQDGARKAGVTISWEFIKTALPKVLSDIVSTL